MASEFSNSMALLQEKFWNISEALNNSVTGSPTDESDTGELSVLQNHQSPRRGEQGGAGTSDHLQDTVHPRWEKGELSDWWG